MQKSLENTHRKNTATYPIRNGISAFAMSPIFSPDTVDAEKMLTATGGVIVPTTLEIHTIIPKWITSIPMLWAIGHRTGTSKTAMAVPSINVPKIRRMIATTKQNKVEFRFIATTVSTSAWEAPEKVICIILVRQLFLSDVLVRLFHALDPLRTTR